MNDATCKLSSLGTTKTFLRTGTCSEATMNVVDRALGQPMELEEHGVTHLAGGIVSQGYQCGMVWGASLAAGAQAHHRLGAGPQAEAQSIRASQGLVDAFGDYHGSLDCFDLTETDLGSKGQLVKFFLKGGPITCTRRVVKNAPVACKAIQIALDTEPPEVGCSPVSCAAELVKKCGLSDKHAVMAAGLAGGIGLSGGACGALGAALWVVGMHGAEHALSYKIIESKSREIVDAFQQHTDFELECKNLVGRTFGSIDDHSGHLRQGGCAEIIEFLAAKVLEARQGATPTEVKAPPSTRKAA